MDTKKYKKTQSQTNYKKNTQHKKVKTQKQNQFAKNSTQANKHTEIPNTKKATTQKTQGQYGEKAYKLLALQHNISLNKAKDLIDSGRVSIKGKRLEIARTLLPTKTHFEVLEAPCAILFEDEQIIALDKSVGIESYSLLKLYPHCKLINRLDKDTSGVILLAKNEKIRQTAIMAFRQKQVEKVYFALIEGKLYDEIIIEKKISTQKDSKAKSHIDKDGLTAQSKVIPLQILEQKTLVSVYIPTGRTHQIRIHLASIKHPIIGDIIYNKTSKIKAKRLMLHCHKTALLGYTLESQIDIHKAFGIA